MDFWQKTLKNLGTYSLGVFGNDVKLIWMTGADGGKGLVLSLEFVQSEFVGKVRDFLTWG